MTGFPATVGVIGGGRTGAGIAQVFAAGGASVTIAERDPASAAAARDRVAMDLLRAAEKSARPAAPGDALARVSVVHDLVEVVLGPATAEDVRDAAMSWVGALGKTAICVRDAPGFATSRLGVLLGLEAIRMLEEGVASPADIDRALQLGYGHPLGPLRTTDLVGLDVRLAIATHLESELGDRFAPPRLLRDKVARGELGRKTGQGFFTW